MISFIGKLYSRVIIFTKIIWVFSCNFVSKNFQTKNKLKGLKVPYIFHIFIHSYNYLWNNELIYSVYLQLTKRENTEKSLKRKENVIIYYECVILTNESRSISPIKKG